jgi:hypothetical protein
MTRRILSLLLLSLMMVLSGCSYRYDFVVINKSDGVIEVQYKLKRYSPETPGKYVDINPPAKVALSEFVKAEYQWQDLAKEQYEFDNLTGTFKVNVAPDEVLRVDYATNYRGDENEFALASIRIDGARGSIDLKGQQAQTQFKVEGDTKYVLRYR